jgi:hypothetical protein
MPMHSSSAPPIGSCTGEGTHQHANWRTPGPHSPSSSATCAAQICMPMTPSGIISSFSK